MDVPLPLQHYWSCLTQHVLARLLAVLLEEEDAWGDEVVMALMS